MVNLNTFLTLKKYRGIDIMRAGDFNSGIQICKIKVVKMNGKLYERTYEMNSMDNTIIIRYRSMPKNNPYAYNNK